jgi:hypothetical protein
MFSLFLLSGDTQHTKKNHYSAEDMARSPFVRTSSLKPLFSLLIHASRVFAVEKKFAPAVKSTEKKRKSDSATGRERERRRDGQGMRAIRREIQLFQPLCIEFLCEWRFPMLFSCFSLVNSLV